MLHIEEAVIVEGIYDKQRVNEVCDAYCFITDGFGIFKDKEKRAFIRSLAREKGIIVLTDSDSAGRLIRNHVKNIVGNVSIKQAYIPEVFGKERRKRKPSAEGKLGVEGIEREALTEVLAPFAAEAPEKSEGNGEKVTKMDFFELGLTGGRESAERRRKLCRTIKVPENLSANGMIDAVNAIMTKKQFEDTVNSINL